MTLPAPVVERVAELAALYGVGEEAVRGAHTLLRLWSTDELASTTITAPSAAVDQHLADAWTGLTVDQICAAGRLADLGTGAGIPALPLAVALPSTQVALVESVSRRTTFLRTAIAECGLQDRCEVVTERAEGWTAGLGVHDVVTSRALARLDVVLEYSAPLLRLGGVTVAWKGALEGGEREAGERAARALGMEISEYRKVSPFEGARDRQLVIAQKISETPDRFPRREGMARKKPLGGR